MRFLPIVVTPHFASACDQTRPSRKLGIGPNQKVVVDGRMGSPESSEEKEVLELFLEKSRRKHCEARRTVNESIPQFTSLTAFPLANNMPPAANFVTGIIKLIFIDLQFGPLPPEYYQIWYVITADGDKAFTAEERDEALAYWRVALNRFDIKCPRPPR